MKVMEFVRTLRDCIVFLLLMAVLMLGLVLEGAGSLRNPWTWVLVVIGAAIVEGLTYMVYKSKPRRKSSD